MDRGGNRAALAHLRTLQTIEARDTRGVAYRKEGEPGMPPADTAYKDKLARILVERYGVDHRGEIAEFGLDMGFWLRRTELNMYEDLADYVGAENAARLDRLALGFIPNLANDAFAEMVPGVPGEHVIGVNVGLYWVCGLLAEALLRTADGDESGGLAAYRAAVKVYLAQDQQQLSDAWNWRSDSDNLDYLVQGGAVGSVVLRFVALHELGHISLGHVGHWRMAYAPASGRVNYAAADELGRAATLAMEREADAFALARFVERTGGAESMWNNMLYIGAYFRLLDHLQRLGLQAPSDHHPPPLERLERLRVSTEAAMGPPPNDAWKWAALVHEEWEKNHDA